MSDKNRIDKWLWSIRIYKSRTLANEACRSGKIKCNGQNVKPSFAIRIDDNVQVYKNGFNFIFKVVDPIQKRVSAPLARLAYQDLTPAEELNKYSSWFIAQVETRDKGTGRPTKKERREIDEFKNVYLDYDYWDEYEN